MPRHPRDRRQLTPRELEVLRLVCQGRSAREIGVELKLSPRTVDKYVARAMIRYQARNRSHLVALAVADGII
jgi:DNA-binding CsgD family transcriptional regulator